MKILAVASVTGLIAVAYIALQSNIVPVVKSQELEGLWMLDSAVCEDLTLNQELNTRIKRHDLQMRFEFHDEQFIKTALGKDPQTSQVSGFRTVGKAILSGDKMVLARQKTEILRDQGSIVYDWEEKDAASVKKLAFGLTSDKLELSTDDACDGQQGRLFFVRI